MVTKKSADYAVDEQLGFILRLAMHFHTGIFTSLMSENLTQTQFATLARIREVGTCTQSDLTRLMALDSATVNGVIERLHNRSFIQIADDPSDGRRQSISLSEQGRQTYALAETVAREITSKTVQALTQSEQRRLVYLLKKMIGFRALTLDLKGKPLNAPNKSADKYYRRPRRAKT